MIRLFK
jgi:NAD(P)-dependent dehydrogenase (short-subunit alcohol dehydrogenase family)